MKKILYNLQLSSVGKHGKILLDKDSNLILWQNTVIAFNRYLKNEYEHHVIIPDSTLSEGFHGYMLKNTHYHVSGLTHTNSAYSGRYHWHANEMRNILRKVRPDVIWENNPSLVNNWKTILMEEKLIDKIPVITYNHWVDSIHYPKLDRRCPYSMRQAEGFLLADLILCNSHFIKEQIQEQVKETFKETFIQLYKKKPLGSYIHPFPPIMDEYEFQSKNYNIEKRDVVRIIYNHRLSSLGYYKDSFKMFLAVLNQLKTRSLKKPVEVVITDVSGKIKERKDIDFEDGSGVRIILKGNMDRKTYLKEMFNSDICVGLFPHGNGGGWSISLAEGIMTGCAVLIPEHSGYAEMAPEYSSVKVYPKMRQVKEKLMKLINDKQERNKNSRIAFEFYDSNYNSKKLIMDLHKKLKKVFK